MARSESKRQKQLAKKKAKRNQKRQQISREKNLGLAERLGRFESAPVVDCLISDDIDRGIVQVTIGRKAPAGEYALASFLVDHFCLGVKDCFAVVTDPAEYRERIDQTREMGVRPIDPASARKFVEDAVDFARSIGLAPHADYRRARPIFEGIDPAEAQETFEMGKDGKPFYIPGPFESAEDTRRILAQIKAHTGNANFLMPVSESDFDDLLFEDEDEYEDEDE